jgi:DNA-binding NtrC family response regulator
MRQPESILIVSPDATTLQSLTRALMRGGAPVTSALGWAEGEARLRRVPVSVVVADLEELGVEELVALRRVRAGFPHVAVIALVSLATPEVQVAMTEGLVAAVLDKPIRLGRLDDAVIAALSRPRVP